MLYNLLNYKIIRGELIVAVSDFDLVRSFLFFLFAVAIFLFGIIILAKKGKDRRFIGLWLLAEAFIMGLSMIPTVMGILHIPVGLFATVMTVNNYVSAALSVLSVILLFLHAKTCYGSKGLIAVLLLALGAYIVPGALTFLIRRTGIGEAEFVRLNYVSRVITDAFIIVCCIIIMVAFIRGRYKDPYSNKLFIIPLFMLIANVLRFGINCIVAGYSNMNYLYSPGVNLVTIFADVVGLVFTLVSGIIVLAQRKKKIVQPQVVE